LGKEFNITWGFAPSGFTRWTSLDPRCIYLGFDISHSSIRLKREATIEPLWRQVLGKLILWEWGDDKHICCGEKLTSPTDTNCHVVCCYDTDIVANTLSWGFYVDCWCIRACSSNWIF
jgi:hypothetical protein